MYGAEFASREVVFGVITVFVTVNVLIKSFVVAAGCKCKRHCDDGEYFNFVHYVYFVLYILKMPHTTYE